MNFDEWWSGYWKPTGQPAVFDAALREIAEQAWMAATSSQSKNYVCERSGTEVGTSQWAIEDFCACQICELHRKMNKP